MSVRTYRRPLPPPIPILGQPQRDQLTIHEVPFEDVFVIVESPLLEFTQKDLVFLRERGIDPFRD